MAEEISVNQMESDKIEPEDVDKKANPNEGLVITKGPPKILSRYLRERRNSCHDLCKFGIQHATEVKPWITTQKRRERKINDSGEKTATSEKNSRPFEETDVSMEYNKSDTGKSSSKPSSLSLHVKERSKSQTKWELVKNKCAFGSSSRKETSSTSNLKRTSSCGGIDKSLAPSFLLSSKQNAKKISSSSDTAKSLIRVSSLKNHDKGEEVIPEPANNDNLPDKILHVIEPASENLPEESTFACDATKPPSPSPSSSSSSSGDKSLKRIGKSGVSTASSRKGLRHAGNGTVSVTLSRQSSGKKFKTNIQHKARSVSRSSSALSSVSSSNFSLRKQNGTTTYKPNRAGHGNQGENVKVGYKIRPKMTKIVGAASKVTPPRKLTFRRGKVIEIQPQSNNIPRRLKFRPVRLLGDDIKRDVYSTRKRTITNKEVDGGELNDAHTKTDKVDLKYQTLERGKNRSFGRKVGVDRSKVGGSKSGSEKVVLRHQKVEGKKQNPRLYNNVIEETASMLAELRKSKVKALVGAFETVISLDSPREATPAEVSTVC
ncbi:uncharacterized protein [Cicer arietinum]|uniref:Uncharacterized protein LOC101495381 n=1 Tax=Cicer arietinum TaxID=3827 RepID=A0A1S2YRC6_CICAR|nr:uncharacterized protein LOC101495381 [Cicer arietinum]XP_012573560.1 uncharacterized protein LOC101495381 [Cicer arietinum]